MFPWLTYSAVSNGAFCIYCFLFGGESTHNATKLQKLPCINYQTCNKYQVHQTAVIRASQFKLFMQQKITSIDVQLDDVKRNIEKNRERLRVIVDAVILRARQNVGYQGHSDDSQHVDDVSSVKDVPTSPPSMNH